MELTNQGPFLQLLAGGGGTEAQILALTEMLSGLGSVELFRWKVVLLGLNQESLDFCSSAKMS